MPLSLVKTWGNFTVERALEVASICWWLLMLVWFLMAFSMKRAKKREAPGERAQHLIPVLLGFWLLFGRKPHWGWLNLRVLPQEPSLWMVGIGDLRGFLAVVIVLASFYGKARREERFLKREFGAGFEEQARQTGMFLPRLG